MITINFEKWKDFNCKEIVERFSKSTAAREILNMQADMSGIKLYVTGTIDSILKSRVNESGGVKFGHFDKIIEDIKKLQKRLSK